MDFITVEDKLEDLNVVTVDNKSRVMP